MMITRKEQHKTIKLGAKHLCVSKIWRQAKLIQVIMPHANICNSINLSIPLQVQVFTDPLNPVAMILVDIIIVFNQLIFTTKLIYTIDWITNTELSASSTVPARKRKSSFIHALDFFPILCQWLVGKGRGQLDDIPHSEIPTRIANWLMIQSGP